MGGSRVLRIAVGACAAGALAFGPVSAADAAEPIKRQIVVNAVGGPTPLQVVGLADGLAADNYKLAFANNTPGDHVLIVVNNLPAGVDTIQEFRDLIVAVESGQVPEPPDSFVGAVFSKPGQNHQRQFDMSEPGQYGYFCPIPTPSGTPHFDLGFIGLFNVV